jgi:hypothetical protein
MMPNGDQPNPEQQIQALQNDLQDAHLVIGQQQVTLLRQNVMLAQMGARLNELEATVGLPEPTTVD